MAGPYKEGHDLHLTCSVKGGELMIYIFQQNIDDITFHPEITRSEKESKRTKNLKKSEEFQIISKNTYVGRIHHSKVPPLPFFQPTSTFFLLPHLPPSLLPFFLPYFPRFSFAWNWISNFSFSHFTISSRPKALAHSHNWKVRSAFLCVRCIEVLKFSFLVRPHHISA